MEFKITKIDMENKVIEVEPSPELKEEIVSRILVDFFFRPDGTMYPVPIEE